MIEHRENDIPKRQSADDELRPVVEVYDGLPPPYIRRALAEGAVFMRDLNGQRPNDLLREEIERMSPEESAAYVKEHLELVRLYEGPGGP